MDTTAPSELGMGILGGSAAAVGSLSYPDSQPEDEEDEEEEEDEYGSPKLASNRGHCRPPLLSETSQKKMRMMPQCGTTGTAGYFGGYFSGGGELTNGGGGGASVAAVGAEDMWYGVGNPWQAAAPTMQMSPSVSSYTSGAVGVEGGKGRGAGSIFYKTKLCSKFRLGSCPFDFRCNFAHGVEELRKPPQGWESLVAPQDGSSSAGQGRGVVRGPPDVQKFKTRPCKFFKEGSSCPYGDRCTFLHGESNCVGSGGGESNSCGSWSAAGDYTNRPPNWKTRICNQWESTGQCSFADKCHFAHGPSELQKPGNAVASADQSYQKVSDAVIYDCGLSWNPSEKSQSDWPDDQDQQQQGPEVSTGLSAYGSYAYQQFPYFRPQLYGYGNYGFYRNGGAAGHEDGRSNNGQQQTNYAQSWNKDSY